MLLIILLIVLIVLALGGGVGWYGDGAYRGPGLSIAGLLIIVLLVLFLTGALR
jgi:hypothetical protein